MPNTSAIWQQAAHTTNHHILAAQREQYKKASLVVLTKKCLRITARGLDRKTREEIGKGNQMATLRFQTGWGTSDIPGLPSGWLTRKYPNVPWNIALQNMQEMQNITAPSMLHYIHHAQYVLLLFFSTAFSSHKLLVEFCVHLAADTWFWIFSSKTVYILHILFWSSPILTITILLLWDGCWWQSWS